MAERVKLTVLMGRRAVRNLAGRVRGHPLIRWNIMPGKADRLVIAPQDLRTADGTRASEIYAGRFAFAGKVVICDGRSPFEITPPSDEWAAAVFGFGWLRHLRAAESGITRANARALVDEWITLQGSFHPVAWQPDITGAADHRLAQPGAAGAARRRRAILSPLPAQPAAPGALPAPHRGRSERRRAAHAGACRADLCGALHGRAGAAPAHRGQADWSRRSNARSCLTAGTSRRNPGALIEVLLDLLPLRQAFAACNIAPPAQLNNAIDRMMPMLRFFRHADGNFAQFNGMGPTQPDLIATILAYDDARGTPLSNAPHSGYQRVEANDLMVLMETGPPPPFAMSQEAHAGCLSFELSSGLQRIVVNCGLPATSRDTWRQVARATAAHSTVVFNDSSSCRFLETSSFKKLIGTPIVDGPEQVSVAREERADAILLRASHDGYADRFSVVHQRALRLSADGHRLDGEDLFVPVDSDLLPDDVPDEFAVRFHLHPAIKANKLTDGRGVMLMLPDREVWTFNAHEDRVELEESVFLSGPDGPRRTVQMVIYGRARKVPRVHWSFAYVTPAGGGKARGRDELPELPLSHAVSAYR